MSGIQEALFRNDQDCTQPALPISERYEAFTPEMPCRSGRVDTSSELYLGDGRSNSTQCLTLKFRIKPEASGGRRTTRLKSARAAAADTPGKGNRWESRRVPALPDNATSGQPRHTDIESIDAQIRRFRARTDLRECLLPGMVGRISPRACLGWQRQAAVRNSRMLAKIKLESCKKCRYCLDPAPPRVGQSVENVPDREMGWKTSMRDGRA